MKKCECSHPRSFHPKEVEEKKNELQQLGTHLRSRFVSESEVKRACMGDVNNKPCPCQGYCEDT